MKKEKKNGKKSLNTLVKKKNIFLKFSKKKQNQNKKQKNKKPKMKNKRKKKIKFKENN